MYSLVICSGLAPISSTFPQLPSSLANLRAQQHPHTMETPVEMEKHTHYAFVWIRLGLDK